MLELCAIAFGGGAGALFRYFVSKFITKKTSKNKYFATLVVNVTGSFLFGLIYFSSCLHTSLLYKTVAVGIIASYTTFSTFEFDNLSLLAAQKYKENLVYVVFSCILCFLAFLTGATISKIL